VSESVMNQLRKLDGVLKASMLKLMNGVGSQDESRD